MKKNIISLGKISKNYLILIFFAFIIGIYTFTLRLLIKDNKEYKFKQNSFMIEVVKYIYLSLCFIPDLIRNRNLKKKNNYKRLKLSLKKKFIIFFICILLLINSVSELFIYKKKVSEILLLSTNNSFLVLTLFIISKLFFDLNFYRHQYASIILIIILEVISYIIVILVRPNNIDLIQIIFEFFIYFFFYVSLSTAFGFIKIAMEKCYFSPYKICYSAGFVNGSIMLISFFIISHYNCQDDDDIRIDDKLCTIKYNEKNYFDNIFGFFKEYLFTDILIFMTYYIHNAISFILFNIIIQKYTMCHVILLCQIISILNNLYNLRNFGKFHKIILISIFILELFASLVFLEIIELNFCGLSKNTIKNIQKRAEEDLDNTFSEENTTTRVSVNDYYMIQMADEEMS